MRDWGWAGCMRSVACPLAFARPSGLNWRQEGRAALSCCHMLAEAFALN